MVTVKIVHGEVGNWKEGDVVKDAPPGLVNIAKQGICNAATGQRVAELIEASPAETIDLDALKLRAKELKIPGYQNMKPENLVAAVQAAEEAQQQQQKESDQVNQDQKDGQNPPDGSVTTDGTNPDQ